MEPEQSSTERLLKCPTCDGVVSPIAEICPHCGHPFAKIRKQQAREATKERIRKQIQETNEKLLIACKILSVLAIVVILFLTAWAICVDASYVFQIPGSFIIACSWGPFILFVPFFIVCHKFFGRQTANAMVPLMIGLLGLLLIGTLGNIRTLYATSDLYGVSFRIPFWQSSLICCVSLVAWILALLVFNSKSVANRRPGKLLVITSLVALGLVITASTCFVVLRSSGLNHQQEIQKETSSNSMSDEPCVWPSWDAFKDVILQNVKIDRDSVNNNRRTTQRRNFISLVESGRVKINPYTYKPQGYIENGWALSLDPTKSADNELRAGASVIMSEAFGITDYDGRKFSGKDHRELTGREYYAIAKEAWNRQNLANAISSDVLTFIELENAGDIDSLLGFSNEYLSRKQLNAMESMQDRLSIARKLLMSEHLWAVALSLKGCISEQAQNVLEMAYRNGSSPTHLVVMEAFQALNKPDQRSIAGVLHMLHYSRGGGLFSRLSIHLSMFFDSFWPIDSDKNAFMGFVMSERP